MICWCCREPLAPCGCCRVALGRLDATTVATVPVCAGCQARLRLPRLLADACGERNAQVADDLGLELVCRRIKDHVPPHRDGLWFWSTGEPGDKTGGWKNITEQAAREAMQ